MKIVLALLLVSCYAIKVPATSSHNDAVVFYNQLEKFHTKIVNFDDGVGMVLTRNVSQGEVILCISSDLIIKDSDYFPLYDYVKHLEPVDILVARVLYEKFMNKRKNFQNIYINTMPTEFDSPYFWDLSDADMLKKIVVFPDFLKFFNETRPYEKLKKILVKIMGHTPDMLSYESYIWAFSIITSHSFFYVNSTINREVIALVPFLDLISDWPKPFDSKKEELRFTDSDFCAISSWNRPAGSRIYRDFGVYESSIYFYRFGKVGKQNPYDNFIFNYADKKGNIKKFHMKRYGINNDFLEYLMKGYGVSETINGNYREFFNDIMPVENKDNVVRAIMRYFIEFKASAKFPGVPGLREIRAMRPENHVQEKILPLGKTIRLTYYKHLEAIQKEIIFSLFQLLLK